ALRHSFLAAPHSNSPLPSGLTPRFSPPLSPLRSAVRRWRKAGQPLLERMKVLRIAREPLQSPGRKRPDQRPRSGNPVLLQRMRREERADRAGRILPFVEQDPEHFGNAVGIDAGLDRGAHALLVGLGLVTLAEVREETAGADVQRRG